MGAHSGYRTTVYFVCGVAALGGLLFGLDQGFIANSLSTIEAVYHLGTAGGEQYSAILASGGVLGALLSGIFARVLGRKRSLILAGSIFSGASLISALLPSIAILSICRFCLGFGVGISSFIVPLYLSETAPAEIRGAMGTLFQLMITLGIFLISVTNVYLARAFNSTVALPLMFLVIALFALLMLGGSLILPESPRWLLLKGRKTAAIAALQRVLSDPAEIDREIQEITATLAAGAPTTSFRELLGKGFLKILAIGVILQMFQQLVGINVMIYYAPTIFGYAHMTGLLAMLAVPTVNILFTIPAIPLVEKWGRKKLLYLGATIMFLTMIAAGWAFQAIGAIHDPTQIPNYLKTMLLIAVITYIFGFAVSWGPVVWLVCSEIFPIRKREFGMTITTMVNWTFAGILMRYSLSFMEYFGKASLFYLFALFCILAILFVAIAVPETRMATLEELERRLKNEQSPPNTDKGC